MTRKEGDRRKHLSKLQIKGQKAQWIDVLTFPTSETQKIRDYPCFPQCENRDRLSGWASKSAPCFLIYEVQGQLPRYETCATAQGPVLRRAGYLV